MYTTSVLTATHPSCLFCTLGSCCVRENVSVSKQRNFWPLFGSYIAVGVVCRRVNSKVLHFIEWMSPTYTKYWYLRWVGAFNAPLSQQDMLSLHIIGNFRIWCISKQIRVYSTKLLRLCKNEDGLRLSNQCTFNSNLIFEMSSTFLNMSRKILKYNVHHININHQD